MNMSICEEKVGNYSGAKLSLYNKLISHSGNKPRILGIKYFSGWKTNFCTVMG